MECCPIKNHVNFILNLNWLRVSKTFMKSKQILAYNARKTIPKEKMCAFVVWCLQNLFTLWLKSVGTLVWVILQLEECQHLRAQVYLLAFWTVVLFPLPSIFIYSIVETLQHFWAKLTSTFWQYPHCFIASF